MKGELHLPDLPEVPVALSPSGGPPEGHERRARQRWHVRVREKVTGYLPLLLMTALALGTWLVAKNTPGLISPVAPGAVRHEPDYTVDRFTLQRFAPDGALKVEIEGDRMSHFPDDDTMEVDRIRVVSTEPDGRRMTATALKGRAKGDGTVVWLDGQAQVVSEMAGEPPIRMNGEHLRAEPKLRRVDSDWPVIVQQAGSEFHADGLFYDADTRVLTLRGKAHALLQPALKQGLSAHDAGGKAGRPSGSKPDAKKPT
ncbi:MAG TPA: LPS export ABC transporter periplasmic protein LptC [Burkholderiaceae bacterium]